MSIEGERHIEMTWRCSTCANVNLGRYKTCQGCGKPKDASEQYDMPLDPESAASVTDDALLRMATAGPDWRCAYCGSDQRASSGACGNCGASAVSGVPLADLAEDLPIDPGPPSLRTPWQRWIVWVMGAAFLAVVAVMVLVWNAHRARSYDATVTTASWERAIVVEHYALHDHEGFQENIPSAAQDVTSVGQKLHHTEQVLDHYETETYSEQVPDGYRSESYTESVPCGQSCSSTPRTCRQSCTSSKNGFAKCSTICTGGSSNCTPKYCSESRTRQVPKTRTELKTRQVAKYRGEPHYAEAFHYKTWDWATDRTVKASGTDVVGLAWPVNGAKTEGLPEGEQERETRSEHFAVTLSFHGETIALEPPNADVFERFPAHSTHDVVRKQDLVTVDGKPLSLYRGGARDP